MRNPVHSVSYPAAGEDISRNPVCAPGDAVLLREVLPARAENRVWRWLVNKGISHGAAGLSRMTGRNLQVASLDMKWLPVSRVAGFAGDTDVMVVGTYLHIEGDAAGHMLLLHEMEVALRIVDMQLSLPEGTTGRIDEFECSILGEMGNIAGSFFLNALADSTSLILMPSPPSVLIDRKDAVLKVLLEGIAAENEHTYAIKAVFTDDAKKYSGTFLVLPAKDFADAILGPPG